MKRISLLLLGLCTIAWSTGCCCYPYCSRHRDWDDSCVQNQTRQRGRHRNRRAARADQYDAENGVSGDCCDSCCDGNYGGSGTAPMTYDGAMGGGCAGGNCAQGAMMNGASTLEGYVPDIDATVVTRILDAGGTITGKRE